MLGALGLAIQTAWVHSIDVTDQQVLLYGHCWDVTPGAPTSYRVLVRNEKSGEGVGGAKVHLELASKAGDVVWRGDAQTDANGIALAEPSLADDVPDGDYVLAVEATSGEETSEVSQAIHVERSYRVLVTTDKPLYQPGHVIHIRALSLATADMRPAAGRETLVEVKDGKGNKVFKRRLKCSEFGIVSADFQLADEVNAGAYVVTATTDDTTSERSVTVKRYVLPKFRVDVKTEAGYYAPGDLVEGEVVARYTFGEPVARAWSSSRRRSSSSALCRSRALKGQQTARGASRFHCASRTISLGSRSSAGRADFARGHGHGRRRP